MSESKLNVVKSFQRKSFLIPTSPEIRDHTKKSTFNVERASFFAAIKRKSSNISYNYDPAQVDENMFKVRLKHKIGYNSFSFERD